MSNDNNIVASSTIQSPAQSGGARLVKPPTGFQVSLVQLQNGITRALPDGSSLMVAGQSLTKAAVLSQIGSAIGLYTTVADQVRSLKQARQSLAQALPAARSFEQHLKDGLITAFGRGNPQLEQFGLKPKKSARTLSSQEQATRAAKSAATRALRHTMGARQKEAVKYQGQPKLTIDTSSNGVTPVAKPVGPGVGPSGSNSGSAA